MHSIPVHPPLVYHEWIKDNISLFENSKFYEPTIQCYRELRQIYDLPKMLAKKETKDMKTLIVDLDETLVHSSFTPIEVFDVKIPILVESIVYNVFVKIRPGAKYFLQEMCKMYEVIIYTASLSKYADPLIDVLDPGKKTKKLFREHCTVCNNIFVKDLLFLGRNLKDTIILDNSPNSYAFQVENAIPITSWYDDMLDTDLYDFIPKLKNLALCDDVRPAIAQLLESSDDSTPDKADMDSCKDLSTSEFEHGQKQNANTPKDNQYFKDNPFNGLTKKGGRPNYTLDSSRPKNEGLFDLALPTPNLVNNWTTTKHTQATACSKQPKSKSKEHKWTLNKTSDKSPAVGNLMSQYKNSSIIIKKGHRPSKTTFTGEKSFDFLKIKSKVTPLFDLNMSLKHKKRGHISKDSSYVKSTRPPKSLNNTHSYTCNGPVLYTNKPPKVYIKDGKQYLGKDLSVRTLNKNKPKRQQQSKHSNHRAPKHTRGASDTLLASKGAYSNANNLTANEKAGSLHKNAANFEYLSKLNSMRHRNAIESKPSLGGILLQSTKAKRPPSSKPRTKKRKPKSHPHQHLSLTTSLIKLSAQSRRN